MCIAHEVARVVGPDGDQAKINPAMDGTHFGKQVFIPAGIADKIEPVAIAELKDIATPQHFLAVLGSAA